VFVGHKHQARRINMLFLSDAFERVFELIAAAAVAKYVYTKRTFQMGPGPKYYSIIMYLRAVNILQIYRAAATAATEIAPPKLASRFVGLAVRVCRQYYAAEERHMYRRMYVVPSS